MARRITRKQLKQDEFVDAAVDIEHWFEHNWRTVASWVGAVVCVVLVALGVWLWTQSSRKEARDLVTRGVEQYRKAESAGFADTEALGRTLATFDQAIGQAGSSPAGRVARFYRGATLYRLGRLDEARSALESVASVADGADTLGFTAQALLAHVHAALGSPDKAIEALQAIVDQPNAIVPQAEALLDLARLASQAGEAERARASLRRIVDEFPQSSAAGEARQQLSAGS